MDGRVVLHTLPDRVLDVQPQAPLPQLRARLRPAVLGPVAALAALWRRGARARLRRVREEAQGRHRRRACSEHLPRRGRECWNPPPRTESDGRVQGPIGAHQFRRWEAQYGGRRPRQGDRGEPARLWWVLDVRPGVPAARSAGAEGLHAIVRATRVVRAAAGGGRRPRPRGCHRGVVARRARRAIGLRSDVRFPIPFHQRLPDHHSRLCVPDPLRAAFARALVVRPHPDRIVVPAPLLVHARATTARPWIAGKGTVRGRAEGCPEARAGPRGRRAKNGDARRDERQARRGDEVVRRAARSKSQGGEAQEWCASFLCTWPSKRADPGPPARAEYAAQRPTSQPAPAQQYYAAPVSYASPPPSHQAAPLPHSLVSAPYAHPAPPQSYAPAQPPQQYVPPQQYAQPAPPPQQQPAGYYKPSSFPAVPQGPVAFPAVPSVNPAEVEYERQRREREEQESLNVGELIEL